MVSKQGGFMHRELRGSELTRTMLKCGYKKIWCAISDESDEQAIEENDGNDFTAYIVAFKDGYFYCTSGMQWLYAVPIKIEEIRDIKNDCWYYCWYRQYIK